MTDGLASRAYSSPFGPTSSIHGVFSPVVAQSKVSTISKGSDSAVRTAPARTSGPGHGLAGSSP